MATTEAEPRDTAVTLPVASTVAMAESEVVHTTVVSLTAWGVTVAVSASEVPSRNTRRFLFNVTVSIEIPSGFSITSGQVVSSPPVLHAAKPNAAMAQSKNSKIF